MFVVAKKDTEATEKLASPTTRPLVWTLTIAILAPIASSTPRRTATPANAFPVSGETVSTHACRFKLHAKMILHSATNLPNVSPSMVDSSANVDEDIPATAMYAKQPTVLRQPTLRPFLPDFSSTPTE